MEKPRFDPLSEFAALRDIMRELTEQGPIDPRKVPPAALASLLTPLDIMDLGDAIVVQVNLPGVDVADVDISLKDNLLTVIGEVKPDADYEGAVYLRRERRITKLIRTVPIPAAVEAARSQASMRNGVLTIKLPKLASVAPKTIKVTVS